MQRPDGREWGLGVVWPRLEFGDPTAIQRINIPSSSCPFAKRRYDAEPPARFFPRSLTSLPLSMRGAVSECFQATARHPLDRALAPRCSDTRTSCRHQTIAAASRLLKEFEDDHAEACVFSEFLGTFPPGPLISPRSLTSLPPSVRVVQ